MVTCLTSPPPPATPDRSVRVLRWVFRRDDEAVICELGLSEDEGSYELRVDPPVNAVGIVSELFDDAVSAFQRHSALERTLVEEGWSLESFESQVVDRSVPAQPPAATSMTASSG